MPTRYPTRSLSGVPSSRPGGSRRTSTPSSPSVVPGPARETDKMSDREQDAYKKSLKAEAEERRRLSREAWKLTRPRTSSIWAKVCSGQTAVVLTSGTCPTPRPVLPRTSCLRWIPPSNWPKHWG